MVGSHQGNDSVISVPTSIAVRMRRVTGMTRLRHIAALGTLVALGWTAVGCGDDSDSPRRSHPSSSSSSSSDGGGAGGTGGVITTRPANAPVPTVVPTPQQIRSLGPDVVVPHTVALAAGPGVDAPTRNLVSEALGAAGARSVSADDEDATLVVRAGLVRDSGLAAALRDAGVPPPADLPAEGYVLAAVAGDDGHPASIVLGGADAAGTYYAAQTLKQLVSGHDIAGVAVVDRPTLPRRGVVEGFYGSPWTQAERLDQLAFYGRMKLNTYIYAPKADLYHRDAWRQPYPAAQLADLHALVVAATANHVRFTFAVSPGVSICYTAARDIDALETKLGALYDQGVRDFAIALDDIAYDRWNCSGDRARYGASAGGAAAQAQVELLNRLEADLVGKHPGTRPLTLVPTEYRNTEYTPYRSVLRKGLDTSIQVMWTGSIVVPAEITGSQAAAARAVFGRPVFVWDNYPVDDFPPTAGRLLLGPYARRDPAMADQVSGLVSNPMNQAAASKVALTGIADFTWNAPAYDAGRAHRAAAAELAAGSADQAQTIDALLAFFDLETFAPTSARSESVVMQSQAPALAAKVSAFDAAWSSGDRAGAIAKLRPYAELLAAAPQRIRNGVTDAGFVADCRPWLDALAQWGQAFVATLDGLQAQVNGDQATARARLTAAHDLAAQARAVHTIAGETKPQGPVLVGDGVLDRFLARY